MWSVWLACVRPEPVPAGAAPLDPEVIAALSMTRVRDDVRWIADESVGGRVPGTPGHDLVRDWLASEMALAGLEPVDGSFVVEVPLEPERARLGLDAAGQVFEVPLVGVGANLFGVRPGVDPALADEVVLLVAHYDHLGVDPSGDAYNGAFDDAAAVCALLELARALDAAHATFARTVAFLFTDAEEDGLDGAVAWVGSPTVPLPDVVAALSVDPIGRPLLADYGPLFVIGAERSERLQAAVDLAGARAGAVTTRLNRTPMIGYASDQDAFWDAPDPVPALWISSGGMSFYHTVDDTPDTIDYGSVRAHLGVVAQLAAELAAGG
ncbi:MAG: M20/M25/M40 family metallo-hydrolase, partial [Myxococcota bacterium]